MFQRSIFDVQELPVLQRSLSRVHRLNASHRRPGPTTPSWAPGPRAPVSKPPSAVNVGKYLNCGAIRVDSPVRHRSTDLISRVHPIDDQPYRKLSVLECYHFIMPREAWVSDARHGKQSHQVWDESQRLMNQTTISNVITRPCTMTTSSL